MRGLAWQVGFRAGIENNCLSPAEETTMKTGKLILIASAILFTLPCSAKDLTVCVDEMSDVYYGIDGGDFNGRNGEMNKSRMLAKYDAAVSKLKLYKFSDAIDKLDDIAEKATVLSTAITKSVSAAIQCAGES
jgi:hypothetical protein